MKEQVLAALITAKRLFNASEELCSIREIHACSAGVVVLQDAVELIVLAALLELGVDEKKSLEDLTFPQMVAELRRENVSVPKSGTIKAMNKQRVLIKHYGETVDPDTARRYFSASRTSIDTILEQVLKKNLAGLFLHELVTNDDTKSCLNSAQQGLDEKKYFRAMIEIRKALFIEIEQEYSIYGWRDRSRLDMTYSLADALRGGNKAPYNTRNEEWIKENVREPFDYIQLDHDRIRADLVEWGVNTQDFWNILRLTPPVFRVNIESNWQVKREPHRFAEGATESNVRYCLDAIITLIIKKQDHFNLGKYLSGTSFNNIEITTVSDPTNIYNKATTTAEVIDVVPKGTRMYVSSVVSGLGTDDTFVYVTPNFDRESKKVFGYVLFSDIQEVGKKT